MKEKKISIGGQAVIEGVMMRSPEYVSTVIRRADGTLEDRTNKFIPLSKKYKILNLKYNPMKVLANDGIATPGVVALEKAGFEVILDNVAQEKLIEYINENKIDVLLVRSATKVREDLIDACPSIKIIGRGGVGMDNIDVEYARNKGVKVINTPAASSHSVAELVFAHLFGMVRFLHHSNQNMPLEGDSKFKEFKKSLTPPQTP